MRREAAWSPNILTNLVCTGNVDTAIKLTIQRSISNAYSFSKYIRQKIIGNDANRDPLYLQRVRHFQHVHFSPQDPEWEQLEDLMAGSLRFQYKVECSKRPYLRLHTLDTALKQIKCMPAGFYEYKLPDEIIQEAIEREAVRRELKHLKPTNISNIQFIISRAQKWQQLQHPWELVACASILCGRRTQEILCSLEWEKESEYVIYVRGLLKQNIGEGPVPILTDFDSFDALMKKIRENELSPACSTHRLKPAFMRLFGEWFSHSQRRNIYCEAAYRLRTENGFHPDMSKIMWFDKALCHDNNVVNQASNLTYQSLTFNE